MVLFHSNLQSQSATWANFNSLTWVLLFLQSFCYCSVYCDGDHGRGYVGRPIEPHWGAAYTSVIPIQSDTWSVIRFRRTEFHPRLVNIQVSTTATEENLLRLNGPTRVHLSSAIRSTRYTESLRSSFVLCRDLNLGSVPSKLTSFVLCFRKTQVSFKDICLIVPIQFKGKKVSVSEMR